MAAHGLHDVTVERALLAEGFDTVIGVDEVGRGALAGPVSVGVAVFSLTEVCASPVPEGIHDSKQLDAVSRAAATARVQDWAQASAVGSTLPAEIDALGMTLSLGLAARRALARVPGLVDGQGLGEGQGRTMVLLDGKHDWLSAPLTLDCLGIFGACADMDLPPVRTIIKGDGSVPVIAAASIVAKVERDDTMIGLAEAHPQYGWESNVGYGTAAHRQAIVDHGPSVHHRRSFRLHAVPPAGGGRTAPDTDPVPES
ncbi:MULTISPECIES: ribonuclease HII [Brevibacterium]|uniref:ribonuclease HII n=1 Tax=Brevibacterium TaxID=1696 RepID=UPI001BA9093D|nr:ribonuclease HII [Brevibacterium sp. W7.2]